jgi:hypothetical protein
MAFDKLKNLLNVDIKDGLTGRAVVQSASVPTEAARSYNVSMWLDVSVEGREPYRVKHECMVKAGKHPWPGTTLPVVVDRIAKLERISKRRESGALSEAEFEAEKARILAG